MTGLSAAIFTKCAAGTTLHTAIGGRIYDGQAPDGCEYPYIVFFPISELPDKTFTENFEDISIQFSIFSAFALSTTEIDLLYGYLNTLYDECTLSITGATLLRMHRTNAIRMSEDHTSSALPNGTAQVWHYAVDYEILLQIP